jgi:hypothetical protein
MKQSKNNLANLANPVRILVLTMIIMVLYSCKEDVVGQYSVDSTPPQPISNPQVKNFPGGATITYTLPDETDLLYVNAKYTLPNGENQDIKASVYTNSLTVKGFARSQEVKLQLVVVDRSQNESTPMEVTIHPEDAVIYTILENMHWEEFFGGFTVEWENPIGEDVAVTFMKKDGTGQYTVIDVIYSSEKEAHRAIDDQDAEPTVFAVSVRDFYNNLTDTVEFELTPWLEVKLDPLKFVAMPKLPALVLHQGWPSQEFIKRLWDGVTGEPDAPGISGLYYINPGEIDAYFTIDLGVKARLSKFRMWGRRDYYFRLHNPQDFFLMGTNDFNVANNSASTNEEWTLLMNCLSIRPSGKDSSQPCAAGDEDFLYAEEGELFLFPEDTPEVRYIRFRVRKTWGGTNGLHLTEMEFRGQPAE